MKTQTLQDLDRPVRDFVRPVSTTVRDQLTTAAAIDALRGRKIEERIVYLYVVDADDCLRGVLPTRRLLLAQPNERIADLMHTPVTAAQADWPLRQVMRMFARHRFLAIPVVDAQNHLLGTVDVRLYADEAIDIAEARHEADVFQLIGVSLQQYEQVSPVAAYRLRMPWLVANMIGGLTCAAIATIFGAVLEQVLVIAAFIPLVLTLAESIAIQSLTLAIQHMHASRIEWKAVHAGLRREWSSAPLIAATCGLVVGGAAVAWGGDLRPPMVIAGVIFIAVCLAATIGVAVPMALHLVKLDPKVAAGPIVLMLVDSSVMLIYLSGASLVLL